MRLRMNQILFLGRTFLQHTGSYGLRPMCFHLSLHDYIFKIWVFFQMEAIVATCTQKRFMNVGKEIGCWKYKFKLLNPSVGLRVPHGSKSSFRKFDND